MGARGKKSAASLEVVRSSNVRAIQRPKPVEGLTPEQAGEWLNVVNRMPADWFPNETHSMLAHYCRHVVSARRVSELIETILDGDGQQGWLEDYDRLLKMQEREGRAMSALATRMRITQQSLVSKDKGKGGTTLTPPHQS